MPLNKENKPISDLHLSPWQNSEIPEAILKSAFIFVDYHNTIIYGGSLSGTVIVVGNGIDESTSNPG